MSTNILPYAQLAQYPAKQMWVAWIDEDTSRANTSQTLAYRELGTSDTYISTNSTRTEIPTTGGKYKHEVFIDNLRPDTEYEGVINGEKSVYFKTFPSRIWRTSLKVCVVSDIHMDTRTSGGMQNGSEMAEIRHKNPSALLIAGDIVTWGNSSTQNATETQIVTDWLTFFSDHVQELNGESADLIPLYIVPGNHEVGNNTWDGTGNVYPDDGFLQFFFSNIKSVDVTETNYGSVHLPRVLQIIGLDTHSSHAPTQGEWLPSVLRTDNYAHLSILHNGFFPGGSRVAEDIVNSGRFRKEISHQLARLKTKSFAFSGHIHTEKRTVPMRWVVEEPSSGSYFDLEGNGYLIESNQEEMGIIEFGEGYRTNRSILTGWYLDFSNGDDDDKNPFFFVEISKDTIKIDEVRFREGGERNNTFTSSRPMVGRQSLMV